MKIISIEKQEHCIGGDFMFIYHFDGQWNKERIMSMARLGQLQYHKNFPRPFFQIKCPDGTLVKGVEFAAEFRVIFPRKNPGTAETNFKQQLWELTEAIT
jgi:hypothetical protein